MPPVPGVDGLPMSGLGCCTAQLPPQLQTSATVGEEVLMPTQAVGSEVWNGWVGGKIGKRLGGEGSNAGNKWLGGQDHLVQTTHVREVGRLQWLTRCWMDPPQTFLLLCGMQLAGNGLTSANAHTV